ncbi:hypothetical protein HY386_02025 [Candidatus Daviesbacteria bacterium]|nr:hypothetical protein [Candidatus Daviesbacteria bacterium]
MNGNIPKPQILMSPSPFYSKKIFYLLVMVVILTLVELFLLNYFGIKLNLLANPFQPATPTSTPSASLSGKTLDESESPIAFDILKNPLVYEWRGSVVGTLVAKDEGSITISDDKGNKIVIFVQGSSKEIYGTKFYKPEAIPDKDGKRFTEVTVDKIPLSTKLHGDFFVFPHRKNELVGSSFNIVE